MESGRREEGESGRRGEREGEWEFEEVQTPILQVISLERVFLSFK